jgi:hypothetical protein
VNLGWLFFRAGSLSQVGQMFSALLSPSTYSSHVLHESLYGLVAGLAIAYAVLLYLIEVLDKRAEEFEAAAAAPRMELMAVVLRERWVWLAPMWAMACVLVLTLIPHASRGANVFMYRFF